jgi:hypothetical protein
MQKKQGSIQKFIQGPLILINEIVDIFIRMTK